jgi:HSP20 family protein
MMLPSNMKDSFERQMDRLLDEAVHAVNHGRSGWFSACDTYEDGETYSVAMALPGIQASEIQVHTEGNRLIIKGERSLPGSDGRRWYHREIPTGPFASSFELPDSVDVGNARASCTNGILTVTFPKRPNAKLRQIMIEAV